MGIFSNPLGYAGYQSGAPTQAVSLARAATDEEISEVDVDKLVDNAYISPATADFAMTSAFSKMKGNINFGTGAGPVTLNLLGQQGHLGFFGAVAKPQQKVKNVKNDVDPGGQDGKIANLNNLVTYSADSHVIRDNFYQLAQGLRDCVSALKAYGLVS